MRLLAEKEITRRLLAEKEIPRRLLAEKKIIRRLLGIYSDITSGVGDSRPRQSQSRTPRATLLLARLRVE